jgi:plastocyanin
MRVMFRVRRWVVLAATIVSTLLLATTFGMNRSAPALAASHTVSIANFAFSPASVTIAVGDTVTWTNNDQTAHTSTADNGAWDSGPLQPGASFSHSFTAAGTFSYHCAIHPFMTATISVVAAPAAAATAQPAAQPAAPRPVAAAPANAAQPASQAAPAPAARAVAPAGQRIAAAPQLPNTGNGGLLGQPHAGDAFSIAWALAALVGFVLVGGALVLRSRWSGREQRR